MEKLSKAELVEWTKRNIMFIPDHIFTMITHAKPLEEQEKHILERVKEHTELWYYGNQEKYHSPTK